MASLSFIFCWRKQIFVMIKFLQEKIFSSNFWTADPLKMFIPHFVAFCEIYILITHWWPISTPKTSNGVEWGWRIPHDVFFPKSMKNYWRQHMKSGQMHNIWKQQHNNFPMRGYSSKSDKLFRNYSHLNAERWKNWHQRTQPYPTGPNPPGMGEFLNFREWKVRVNFELLTKNRDRMGGVIFTPHQPEYG